MELVLASASPRREMLLRQIGLDFEIEPSGVEEPLPEGIQAEVLSERLAMEKAKLVASQRSSGLVIGADTIVVLDGTVLGKPASVREAEDMLRQLSGREHQVITGVAVVDATTGRSRSDHVSTAVRFANLDDRTIARYVASGEPVDKAGAYAIQGLGALLVESISGCYSNVVGLPLRRLVELLREFGYQP